MKPFPLVSVVILNYNGKYYLERNLPFLLLLTYPNLRLCVIDNNSTDGSVQWLQKYYPQVDIIYNEKNFGFAKGYNIGLQQIKSEYFLLLNTDVEVTPKLIEPMVATLENDASSAVCQPKILSMLKKESFEYAGAAGGLMDKLGYPFARGRLFFTCEEDHGQYDDIKEIFWASGACFLIKASCFWEMKGFYEYFFMQSEETDLCWRLKLAGYKILYCSQSSIYHLGGAHLAYASSKKTFLNFRNNWVMLYRNMPTGIFWLKTAPLRLILDMAASFYFLVTSNLKNFIAVYNAIFQFFLWYIKTGRKEKKKISNFTNLTGVQNISIVVAYFIKKKKRYIDL